MNPRNLLSAFFLIALVLMGYFINWYRPIVAGVLAAIALIVSFNLFKSRPKPVPEPVEPPVEPEPAEEELAQAYIETELRMYWQAKYEAYTNDIEDLRKFWESYLIPRSQAGEVPDTVKPIFGYYYQNVEQADWGNVYLYKTSAPALWVVYVTTDGDDGWVELFNLEGQHLGTARRYIELLSWGDPELIREMVKTGAYPADLESRMGDTLWGK